MNSELMEEVFSNEYFSVNKKLLLACGLWPFAPKLRNLITRIFMSVVMAIVTMPHLNALRVQCGKNLGLCGENVAASVYTIGILLKYLIIVIKEKKICRVYELLATTWASITDPAEKEIMIESAEVGKIKTYGYIGYVAVAGIAFTQTGMIPTVLDFMIPLNESRPRINVVNGEYFIDQDAYFFEIYYFYCLVGVVSSLVLMCVDPMYTVVVHQYLGIFRVVKHRLHLATKEPCKSEELDTKEDDYAYNTIISAIRLHQEAIEFNDLMENTYDIVFLMLILICVLFLSFGAITLMENADNLLDLFRMSFMELGVCIHLLYMSWPGQLVITESEDLFVQVYANRWYHSSPRAKKLLQIMMLRCMKPCYLTAAGLYVMNFENYGAIIKTTVSYITVLASFRE